MDVGVWLRGLGLAARAVEQLQRMHRAAAGRVGEGDGRRIGSAPGSIVSGDRPEVSLLDPAAAGIEHRRLRLVDRDLAGVEIGPTRCEDRSIGSSRRKWRKIAPRRTLKRHRLAKRHQIGPGAPRICEPVGRRDGDATKRKRRRRGIRPASAIGVSARNPRRFGRETFRPQHGSASPPVAITWAGLLPPIFRDGCSCACSPIGSKPPHSGISTGRFCDVCTSTGTKPSSRGTLAPLQPAGRRAG
jgi:hypothetical protein